ncbi:methyl methanesulfonate-sensitivity protein 22 [Hysterangium stoloniferum]|nr:methyl methanesulfonate-sensitivity protein 22 [Hysterangium stoloniferum]
MVEAALELQSNQPEQQLYKSEYIWRTVFSLCALSQFTAQGIVTSSVRLKAHWPIIKKALGTIRLNADERDNSTPAFTLQKRDTYLRLVTARCYLLTVRWNWSLVDADDVFHGLCAIFRSRQFSNLLGEPNDFPAFIRNQDETLFHVNEATDTAYSLFLKLIIRAVKDFSDKDSTGRLRTIKLSRLLSLTVPVGSMSFSKAQPPVFQALSMLYNRYSAVFVAIYVDPSDKHIRSRLQQARRYITFKDADSDSRTAAIRSLLHLGILLQHLDKPLDDILNWTSEILEDLLTELSPNLGLMEAHRQPEREKVILSAQMLLRTITTIMNTSGLASSVQKPPRYPDTAFVQVLLPRLLSGSLVKDHRTGLEICGCIRSFLDARHAVLPSPTIPKPDLQNGKQESQDDYGDGGLDLNDPMLLALFDNIEEIPDENRLADKKASEIMDGFSQSLYTCVCMHLGCSALDCNYDEADEWLKIWLGYGSVLVRNKKRDWNYYLQLAESASRDIVDAFRRIHIRLRVATSILWLDYSIYGSRTDYFVKLWIEAIISPNITIQHEFSAVLFSVDSLRHPLLRDMPCIQVDPVSGYFNLERNNLKERRLQIVTSM